jgi:hypothetical protein
VLRYADPHNRITRRGVSHEIADLQIQAIPAPNAYREESGRALWGELMRKQEEPSAECSSRRVKVHLNGVIFPRNPNFGDPVDAALDPFAAG